LRLLAYPKNSHPAQTSNVWPSAYGPLAHKSIQDQFISKNNADLGPGGLANIDFLYLFCSTELEIFLYPSNSPSQSLIFLSKPLGTVFATAKTYVRIPSSYELPGIHFLIFIQPGNLSFQS
jgi:hypothetical protein